MKVIYFFLLFFALNFSVFAQNEKVKIAAARIGKAIDVFSHFTALGSDSLPAELFKKAKAVAVFGEIEKNKTFPFTLGAPINGYGLLVFRQETGWSVPTFLRCRGMETGLNLKLFGKEKLGTVFLFMTDKSIEIIKKRNAVGKKITGKELALGPLFTGKGAELTIEKA